MKILRIFFDHLFFSLVVAGIGLGIGTGLFTLLVTELSLAEHIVTVLLVWAVVASGLAALLTLRTSRARTDRGFPWTGGSS